MFDSIIYEPDTGKLYRRYSTKNHHTPNGYREIAKKPVSGGRYKCVRYKNQMYYAHVVAWYLMTGRWPRPEIDHINRDGLDNRWCNLREVTRSENMYNRRGWSQKGSR